jgi:CrcB protein
MGRDRVFYVNVLFIAIGGAIGSVGRHLLAWLVLRMTDSVFPFGIFLVNVLGCAIFGVIVGAAERRVSLSLDARAFLLTGVLGGFTTFSTYAFNSVSLMRDGQWSLALLNMMGQMVLGVAALWGGMLLVR